MSSLSVEELGFAYRGRVPLFSSLSLSFDSGGDGHADSGATLLLGRNGAGKSTLLQLLAGLLRPKSGAVRRQGRVAYLPQRFVAVPGLSCLDYVAHLAWLYGRSRAGARADASLWLDRVGLADYYEQQRNTELSGGQQSRLALATALNAHAEFILLDEPGAALDPISKAGLHDLYRLAADAGAGLVVSSHDPMDIHGPFSRVVLLDAGEVIFSGTRDEFMSGHHTHPVTQQFVAAMTGPRPTDAGSTHVITPSRTMRTAPRQYRDGDA